MSSSSDGPPVDIGELATLRAWIASGASNDERTGRLDAAAAALAEAKAAIGVPVGVPAPPGPPSAEPAPSPAPQPVPTEQPVPARRHEGLVPSTSKAFMRATREERFGRTAVEVRSRARGSPFGAAGQRKRPAVESRDIAAALRRLRPTR